MIRATLAVAVVALYVTLAHADSRGSASDAAEKIAATLKSRFPELKVVQVNPLPQLAGMYEVVTATGIAYTEANADFLIEGRMFDTRTRVNVTAERWDSVRKIDFGSLPLDRAIKTVRGDGSRRMAVFADPDCPFCKQLEHDLQGVTNVTVYTFLYPLESVHPDSRNKAAKIWCSKERSTAWEQWMLNGVWPDSGKCSEAPTDELLRLGEQLHVDSTPTLFFADGRRASGALKREQIEQLLATASTGS